MSINIENRMDYYLIFKHILWKEIIKNWATYEASFVAAC
jgi:hypothetical protein